MLVTITTTVIAQVSEKPKSEGTKAKETTYISAHELVRDGKTIAVGGVALKEGSSLNFSAKHGGFWKVDKGLLSKVGCRDATGTMKALVEIKDKIIWTEDGIVTEGMNNLMNIITLRDGKEVADKIITRKQTKNGVEIAAEKGKHYVLSDFRYNFECFISTIKGK
jgi:hypothetical protein